MKKTLIAMAVLAASGASFAQATITGSYAFGYAQTSGGGAASASGFGTDTAAVKFAASEDLGGGLKAEAQVSFGGGVRGSNLTGEDAKLVLTGGFGQLTLGTVESGNGLLGIGSSGASGYGLDGKVIGGSSNVDVVGYGVPLTSSMTFGLSYVDRGTTGDVGLGAGTTGTSSAQQSITPSITYKAGPLAAKLDFTSWGRQNEAAAFIAKDRYRLSAAYDAGAVRLSGGYSSTNQTNNVTATETLIGIKLPLGAVTVGLDYAIQTKTNDHDVNGWSLGVGYDLSKRTSVSTSLASWKQRGTLATAATPETSNGFRILVAHSF